MSTREHLRVRRRRTRAEDLIVLVRLLPMRQDGRKVQLDLAHGPHAALEVHRNVIQRILPAMVESGVDQRRCRDGRRPGLSGWSATAPGIHRRAALRSGS